MIREPAIDDDGSRSVGIIPGLTDDGRQYFTRQFVYEYPFVREFLARFHNYYIFDPIAECWFGPAMQ